MISRKLNHENFLLRSFSVIMRHKSGKDNGSLQEECVFLAALE